MKNNLEQVWKEEARKAYRDQQSQDNEGGCREPIGFVQGYLAAKKSDFEEIKTLKEELERERETVDFYADSVSWCHDSSVLGNERIVPSDIGKTEWDSPCERFKVEGHIGGKLARETQKQRKIEL